MNWRILFDASTKLWRFYGRVAFVESETMTFSLAEAVARSSENLPLTSVLTDVTWREATSAEMERYRIWRGRQQQWLQNVREGVTNQKGGF